MQLRLEHDLTELSNVTFCFIDIETTGTSPQGNRMTEVGAVKTRGGEQLAHLRSFVHTEQIIPPFITVLTGITQSMLVDAPDEGQVISHLMEFAQGCVLVGHNFRFDLSFLNAAAQRSGYPLFEHPVLDTLSLSRKLLSGEVENHKLGTLARYLRVDHQPSHRALDDAAATAQIFHCLLERAGTIGVTHLCDLESLPSLNFRAGSAKLTLTTRLPHARGLYRFIGADGEVLYVGKAADIKTRVRSYFHSEQRRKIPQLLGETRSIEAVKITCELELEVRELAEIERHQPRFNHLGKAPKRLRYLVVDGKTERFGILFASADPLRWTVSSAPVIGPFTSKRAMETAQSLLRRLAARTLRSSTTTFWESALLEPRMSMEVLATETAALMATDAHAGRFEQAEEVRVGALLLLRKLTSAVVSNELTARGSAILRHGTCDQAGHELRVHDAASNGARPLRPILLLDDIPTNAWQTIEGWILTGVEDSTVDIIELREIASTYRSLLGAFTPKAQAESRLETRLRPSRTASARPDETLALASEIPSSTLGAAPAT